MKGKQFMGYRRLLLPDMIYSSTSIQYLWRSWSVTFFYIRGPVIHIDLILIQTWINNYIHYDVWDEITDPLLNLSGCAVKVWEWKSNFIPHFTMTCHYFPLLALKLNHVRKGALEQPMNARRRGRFNKCYLLRSKLDLVPLEIPTAIELIY